MSPVKYVGFATVILFVLVEYLNCEIYTAVFRIQEAMKEEAALLKEAGEVIESLDKIGRRGAEIDQFKR
jgi:hypothetical protein